MWGRILDHESSAMEPVVHSHEHGNKILIIKANKMLARSGWCSILTLLAGSNITSMKNTYCCIYSVETPDDEQQICPKHVEFFNKNKFEKKCILLAFIIRIYHDARSSEDQMVIKLYTE